MLLFHNIYIESSPPPSLIFSLYFHFHTYLWYIIFYMFYCFVYNLFYLNCCVILYIFSCNSHPLFIWHSNLTQSMCNISDQQVYALPRAKHNFAMLTHTNKRLTFSINFLKCIYYLSIILMLITLTS